MCEVPKCKRESIINYYGKDVCGSCWGKHCDDNNNFNLKEIFKIKDEIKKEDWKTTFKIQ